jgi:hypothetical protein
VSANGQLTTAELNPITGSEMVMDSHDLAWLAGWLEGEGCFIVRPPTKGRGWGVSIEAASTDRDVVLRAQRMAGGTVHALSRRADRKHKPLWLWAVYTRSSVLSLAAALRPLMSQRRAARITEMLATPDSVPPKAAA